MFPAEVPWGDTLLVCAINERPSHGPRSAMGFCFLFFGVFFIFALFVGDFSVLSGPQAQLLGPAR